MSRTKKDFEQANEKLSELQATVQTQSPEIEKGALRVSVLEERLQVAEDREKNERNQHTEEVDFLRRSIQSLEEEVQTHLAARGVLEHHCKELQAELQRYVLI